MTDTTHSVHPDVWRVHSLHQAARRLGRSLTTRAECVAYTTTIGEYIEAREAAEAVLGPERVAMELARMENGDGVTP